MLPSKVTEAYPPLNSRELLPRSLTCWSIACKGKPPSWGERAARTPSHNGHSTAVNAYRLYTVVYYLYVFQDGNSHVIAVISPYLDLGLDKLHELFSFITDTGVGSQNCQGAAERVHRSTEERDQLAENMRNIPTRCAWLQPLIYCACVLAHVSRSTR